MRFNIRVLAVFAALLMTGGCAQLQVSNPFAVVSDVREVYFGQFTDVPVPTEMKGVPSGTMTTPTQAGVRVGLETYEGRVDPSSLANAMIHNMARQGWSLSGTVTGKRTMQLHEKDQRYAVINIYGGTINTTMEVWVLNRLSGTGHTSAALGAAPLSTGGGISGTGTPAPAPSGSDGGFYSPPPASSAEEQWEGGVSSSRLAN